MDLSWIVAFLLMLGPLVFLHELGHFVVAKMCGVRVLKFAFGYGTAIGFGRFRLAFQRGETEYLIAWFPLGGYVKLLGEGTGDEVEEAEAKANPERTLNHKSAWQKIAIYLAGPVMNLLIPVAVFTATLFVGIPRALPVVGNVEQGSAAEIAGLRPGDRVLRVDGASIDWWEELDEPLRKRPGESITLDVERDGAPVTLTIVPGERSGIDEIGTVARQGFAGVFHERLSATLGVPSADAPAARAGLRSGDRVRAVAGAAVEDWIGFERALSNAGEGPVSLRIDRGKSDAVETLDIPVPRAPSPAALGLVPATVLIARVDADSAAEKAGLREGDLLLTVDGRSVGNFLSFAMTVRSSEGRPLAITYARDGEARTVRVRPLKREITGELGMPETRWLLGIASGETPLLAGAMGEEVSRNPLVAVPRAFGMTADLTKAFLGGLGKLVTGEVPRNQIAGPIGIAEMAHRALQRGWQDFLGLFVLISINLGVLNLLPIPVLDGGQIVVAAVEGARRAPISPRTREAVQTLGVSVLVILMGFAFWNDLSRHWSTFLSWLRSSSGL